MQDYPRTKGPKRSKALVKEVGRYLKNCRKQRGLRQSELGSIIGYKEPLIANVENGTHLIPLGHAKIWVKTVDADPEHFIYLMMEIERERLERSVYVGSVELQNPQPTLSLEKHIEMTMK